MSAKRATFRPFSLLTTALTGAAAAVAAAAAAVALLAAPAAGAGTPARTAGLDRAGGITAVSPAPVITGARLAIVLRHDSAARPAVRLDRATAAAQARAARRAAQQMLGRYHWGSRQFGPLDKLWNRESGWNKYASNPYSGAYGIPQAVPASKMASAGPNWRSNATTQIRWGLRYIKSRYGSPAGAWAHELAYGWY